MHPTNCLNCGTILTADDNFCPTCGQKTDTHRLTLKHILHEFFHSFTHADKGFLGMIADLAIKPGKVAREYVAGKRKKYFNPFTFFLLSIGVLVFSSHLYGALDQEQKPDPKVLAQMPSDAARKYYTELIHRGNEGREFISKKMNTVTMLVVPFYAFLSWIFFGRRRYNYAEVLLSFILLQSFVSLCMAVLVIPWIGKVQDQTILLYVFVAVFVLMSTYIGLAQYSFLGLKNRWKVIPISLVALVGYIMVFLAIFLSIIYYMVRSNFGVALRKMWEEIFK